MSPGGRPEQVGILRDAIGRLEGDGIAVKSFGLGRDGVRARVPLGAESLDRTLRGGLGRGALHEVIAAAPGDAGAASGFALALAVRLATAGRPVVWIIEDAARAEHGAPYAPGLAAHGLDPGRLVVVAAAGARDALWAMEEALKAGAGAVLADLRRLEAYDLVASRRLVLAAQKGASAGLLVAAGAPGLAARLSSSAATRFEVRAAPSPALAAAARKPAVPGRAAFAVRLARIRAGPGGALGVDPDWFWPLVWDHAESVFRDALPFTSPAAARDRPASPAADGRRAA